MPCQAALLQIADVTDQKQRLEQYQTLLHRILQSGDLSDAEAFVDHSERPQVIV
jgi:hypothetical protein